MSKIYILIFFFNIANSYSIDNSDTDCKKILTEETLKRSIFEAQRTIGDQNLLLSTFNDQNAPRIRITDFNKQIKYLRDMQALKSWQDKRIKTRSWWTPKYNPYSGELTNSTLAPYGSNSNFFYNNMISSIIPRRSNSPYSNLISNSVWGTPDSGLANAYNSKHIATPNQNYHDGYSRPQIFNKPFFSPQFRSNYFQK